MKEFHIALSSPCVLLISLLIKTTTFVLIKAVCIDIYGVYLCGLLDCWHGRQHNCLNSAAIEANN